MVWRVLPRPWAECEWGWKGERKDTHHLVCEDATMPLLVHKAQPVEPEQLILLELNALLDHLWLTTQEVLRRLSNAAQAQSAILPDIRAERGIVSLVLALARSWLATGGPTRNASLQVCADVLALIEYAIDG